MHIGRYISAGMLTDTDISVLPIWPISADIPYRPIPICQPWWLPWKSILERHGFIKCRQITAHVDRQCPPLPHYPPQQRRRSAKEGDTQASAKEAGNKPIILISATLPLHCLPTWVSIKGMSQWLELFFLWVERSLDSFDLLLYWYHKDAPLAIMHFICAVFRILCQSGMSTINLCHKGQNNKILL